MPLVRRSELAATFRLALPIVLAQLGLMSMGVVDTVMVGRVSAEALAAVALGNLYFVTLTIPATGLLMVLDPFVAQAVGARDDARVALAVQRGLILAGALAVLSSVALWPVRPVLAALHEPEPLVRLAASYVRISVVGVVPFLAFAVLRQSLQALHHPRPVVVVAIAANVVNAGLNWVLIYGHLGMRPLGVAGSAWATCVSRWVMAAAVLAAGWRTLRPTLVPWRRSAAHRPSLLAMARLGAPIGLQQLAEIGVFAAVGLLMGLLGTREMAAHQIALNLASLTFMVPLGVGAAAAVRVGYAVGAHDPAAARERARTALVFGAGFMTCTGVAMIAAPRAIAALYTDQRAVADLAALLIPIAGVFQVFDGMQAVSAGVLRGLGDTRAPFAINLAGFWLVGFPVSIALGFHSTLGAVGLWWGLVCGLVIVAALLVWRVRRRLGARLERVAVGRLAEG